MIRIEKVGRVTKGYRAVNRVSCWRLEVDTLGIIRARFTAGSPKNRIETASCSLLEIWLSWVATGLSCGVVGTRGPSVVRKVCI